MDNSYYTNHLFNSIDIEPGHNDTKDLHPIQTDGLVYNHIQQTLQVQTDLKNQERIQDFLNSAIIENDSILGFDELYSSVTTESDLSYLQLMQHTTPFHTPLEPLMNTSALNNCNNNNAFDISTFSSVAGLDTGCTFTSTQQQQLLCHPLSSFPDITMDVCSANSLPCDYHLNDNEILAGIDCNAFNTSNDCFKEMSSSSFAHTLVSYPSFTANAHSLSTNPGNDNNRVYRNNSTPILSASYSFSSFSSASSNEEDSIEDELKDLEATEKRRPKKSASISFLPEQRKTSVVNRSSSIKKPVHKFSKKHSISSDNLSYYLSKQHLSDEELEEDSYSPKARMSSAASSGMICKKGRNVDKACNHCKRSHLRCDNVRPCRRCVATGKTGCQDVKHKPRGRPRLQKRI